MLMIVPLMIWSARMLIESQAWSDETSIAVDDPGQHADEQGRRNPEDRPTASPGIAWLARPAATKPTKAELSIIPSMPMFTTPERSFMIPHSAPRTSGAPRTSDLMGDDGSGMTAIEVADELEEDPEDRDPVEDVTIVHQRAALAVGLGDRLELRRRLPRSAPDPEDPADDDVGGEEEEDRWPG